MTPEERQQIIEVINRDIKKLTKKITELKEFTSPVSPDNAIGRISRMDAINNKSIVDASMRNLQSRLDQLQKISQVVHDKDYGLCLKCHQPIAIERLKIRPEIRFCAECLNK
ncbi:transcriptional regulator, TraR/DksA family [Tangfeifania diversioriginum]|uniref:Transcriptional regulator, TraR/DksA family n=1 Tax=Tangfeifania diversioriginum TaxID=1168035 RepID=A0A1M6MML3_9BACT|nr:TraR/DksA C4-type zinc finger protein [Tangfeifania diversioriginum]SHJ84689.1 transcriptional regulator, TraR/DksA family [Tangfeifania diversioriginum]